MTIAASRMQWGPSVLILYLFKLMSDCEEKKMYFTMRTHVLINRDIKTNLAINICLLLHQQANQFTMTLRNFPRIRV